MLCSHHPFTRLSENCELDYSHGGSSRLSGAKLMLTRLLADPQPNAHQARSALRGAHESMDDWPLLFNPTEFAALNEEARKHLMVD